jgi:3-hydroxyacyl-[acyl-carrier-protein] dehydratase
LIEGMAQTAGVMCILTQNENFTANGYYFVTIDKAKFRKLVVPGDTIEYHMSKIARKKNMWWFQGKALVAGRLVAEAKVGAILS